MCHTSLLIACEQDPARKLSANLYDVYHCCVYIDDDDGQRNCPKHVEFYSKNKFETLVHLVGFVLRWYHDAPSYDGQIWCVSFIPQICRVYFFYYGLTCMLMLPSYWPSMYWVRICVGLCLLFVCMFRQFSFFLIPLASCQNSEVCHLRCVFKL